MASLQKTYSGDLTESIVTALWNARNVAEDAKENALNTAKGYGVDPMLRPGEFYAHAIGERITRNLPKRFQHKIPNVTMANPSYIARGQSSSDPLMGTPAHVRNLPEYQQLASSAERKFKGSTPITSAPKISNTTTRERGVKVKDTQLGNFLSAVALSLSSSLNIINQKLDETSEGVIVAREGIANTHKKLEEDSDSLISKLDAIIDALNFQNLFQKQKKDEEQAKESQERINEAEDLSTANRVIMQDMDAAEIEQLKSDDRAKDDRGPIGDPWEESNEKQLRLPSLERGGVVSGPDSGYLAVLHGDEAVVPLDNNATQGQPSAVGKEPIADMPMLNRGNNPDGMKPRVNRLPSIFPKSNMVGDTLTTGSSDDMLVKAIELPTKAAGIVTMGIMGKVLQNTNLSNEVVTQLKSLSAPIADAFGIPDIVTSNLVKESETREKSKKGRSEFLDANRGQQRRRKGLFGRIADFFTGGGTGGGSVSVTRNSHSTHSNTSWNGRGRGGGGNTTVNNINRSPTKRLNILNPFDWPAILKEGDASRKGTRGLSAPGGGLPDRLMNRNQRIYDMMKEAGMSNNSYNRSVTYDTAFNYDAFNSPQYGLNTIAQVVNEASMNDELVDINDIVNEGSDVVLNNQNAVGSKDIQQEYSAIAVKGSPFPEGTYIPPYA